MCLIRLDLKKPTSSADGEILYPIFLSVTHLPSFMESDKVTKTSYILSNQIVVFREQADIL